MLVGEKSGFNDLGFFKRKKKRKGAEPPPDPEAEAQAKEKATVEAKWKAKSLTAGGQEGGAGGAGGGGAGIKALPLIITIGSVLLVGGVGFYILKQKRVI